MPVNNQPITLKRYSVGEEIFNAVTHGVGAFLSIIGATILITLSVCFANGQTIFACTVYGISLVLLYTMSTLYHAFPFAKIKQLFRIFDHSTVYLLIAGSYTPFTLITLSNNAKGKFIFIGMWVAALIGILLNVINIEKFKWVSLVLYVGMGWAAIIAIQDMIALLPAQAVFLLILGGVSYTGGIAFYLMKKKKYMHSIWHLFVLGGSIAHYFCILLYVLPSAYIPL